jgi:SLOG cluster2
MSGPMLVPRDALRGVNVGISVSDSADLARLGLAPQHCQMAVAELARAIMIAGGTVVYGGRLVPPGFTDILLDEVRRYREDRDALIICLAETEHRRLSDDELRDRERQLHSSAQIRCLDADGNG